VIGTNKEPEEGTINKIKSFLKDKAEVYSLINARGKPTAYNHKPLLIDDNLLAIEKRIKSRFEELLENHYSGNIILEKDQQETIGKIALISNELDKNLRGLC